MGEFMLDKKYVRLLAGPIGGGKSVCCAHELFRWMTDVQQPNADGVRKTRFLIVRNTADQLRSTVQKTLHDWFPPGVACHWKATEKTMVFDFVMGDGTRAESEWMLLALDTPDDIRKALSLEATGLWGNECRELHPDVIDALLGRINRYPSMKDGGATRAGAIFDTNMPDEETWWFDKMENPPKNWGIHVQPPAILSMEDYLAKHGEEPDEARAAEAFDGTIYAVDPESDNYANLAPDYYPNLIPGKTQDYLDVYLRCRFGRSLGGFPVYDKTFRADFHVATSSLKPVKAESYPLMVGLDFGRTPAAVIMQLAPGGRVHVLSELTSTNMGIETFLATKLKPHLYEFYQNCPVTIAPDPAGWAKTQVGEVSPVDVIKRAGFKVVKPPSNKPNIRIEAVENLLTKQIDGKAALLIDPSCTALIKGFKYGYRWKTNKKGDLDGNEPVKNEYSHPHDALQYGSMMVNGGFSGQQASQRREVVASGRKWA
jgi:hypothetical protein